MRNRTTETDGIGSRSPYGERESKLTGQEEGVIGAYVAPRMGSVNLNYNVDFGNPQVNVAPRRGSGNLN